MYIGEIIKKYRKENNISQRAFASKTSLSASYINTLEKIFDTRTGKPISVTVDAAKEIANAMNITIDTLLSLIDDNQEFALNTIPLSELQQNKIYVVGKVRAGYDLLSRENILGHIYIDFNPPDLENYYALCVTGDSMEPLISDGDIIVAHKQEDFESGNTCVVLVNGDEGTIKKVIKKENGIELISMNPYYPPRFFSSKEIKELPVLVIAKVVEARKKNIFE